MSVENGNREMPSLVAAWARLELKDFANFHVVCHLITPGSSYLFLKYKYFTYLPLLHSPLLNTRSHPSPNTMPQTRSHGQHKPVKPPAATSQPTKRKHGPKKKTTTKELGAGQEIEGTGNKLLADLEVAHPCDNDLPTPRPLSDSRRSSTLSQTNSRANISALVAQQRRGSATASTTEPSGGLPFDGDGYTVTNRGVSNRGNHY